MNEAGGQRKAVLGVGRRNDAHLASGRGAVSAADVGEQGQQSDVVPTRLRRDSVVTRAVDTATSTTTT